MTYIDLNSVPIQLDHNESDKDEKDLTTARVDITPPPVDADISSRKLKRTNAENIQIC